MPDEGLRKSGEDLRKPGMGGQRNQAMRQRSPSREHGNQAAWERNEAAGLGSQPDILGALRKRKASSVPGHLPRLSCARLPRHLLRSPKPLTWVGRLPGPLRRWSPTLVLRGDPCQNLLLFFLHQQLLLLPFTGRALVGWGWGTATGPPAGCRPPSSPPAKRTFGWPEP